MTLLSKGFFFNEFSNVPANRLPAYLNFFIANLSYARVSLDMVANNGKYPRPWP